MLSRTVKVVKTAEACEKTWKGPISTKWVGVDKSHGVGPAVGADEAHLSRQATIRDDGQDRKTMYLDPLDSQV